MSSKAMSLKGKIKNYAKSNNIAAQVVLQNHITYCVSIDLPGYIYSKTDTYFYKKASIR